MKYPDLHGNFMQGTLNPLGWSAGTILKVFCEELNEMCRYPQKVMPPTSTP